MWSNTSGFCLCFTFQGVATWGPHNHASKIHSRELFYSARVKTFFTATNRKRLGGFGGGCGECKSKLHAISWSPSLRLLLLRKAHCTAAEISADAYLAAAVDRRWSSHRGTWRFQEVAPTAQSSETRSVSGRLVTSLRRCGGGGDDVQ